MSEIFTDEQLQLFKEQRFNELNFDLLNSLKRFPNDINALFGLGICAVAMGEPEKAAIQFVKALEVDDSIRFGNCVRSVEETDPEDWLMTAEELGHAGFAEVAIDICYKISSSGKFTPKIRALASKTAATIKQDYYTAKERISVGKSRKEKLWTNATWPMRIFNIFVFIILPLTLITLSCVYIYSEYLFSSGKAQLQVGIYYYNQISLGRQADNNYSAEHYFDYAETYLWQSYKWNPLSSKSLFYLDKGYTVYRKLGRLRNSENIYDPVARAKFWNPARGKLLSEAQKQAQEEFKKKEVSKEKVKKLENEWNEFYKIARVDPGTAFVKEEYK
ncbi:hypothetical protein IJT10_04700 [bacterium]|nr:hypothetical protein [bacterium]